MFNFSVEGDESYTANGFAVHNCACELIEVPDGWDFDDAGDLVPESMLRRARRDVSLIKAERAARTMLYRAPPELSIRIADPLLREAVEAVVRETPPEVFQLGVGVTLITTDHRRDGTPLDDADYAYWSGSEIRIQGSIDVAKVRRVLQHEIGHSLNAWSLAQRGSLDAVREFHGDLWVVSEAEGFVSSYAAREPIENHAEVCRLYLYDRHRLRLRWPRQLAVVSAEYQGIWALAAPTIDV